MEIVSQHVKRTYATCCFALLAVGCTAVPAAAGGLLPIASPAFGTLCANHGTSHSAGATSHGAGTASENLTALPISNPANQCGGADLTSPAGNDPTRTLQLLLG
ncbi:hypothetical protein SUDANB113_00005 [Streptomyces sp. enrichment culture]